MASLLRFYDNYHQKNRAYTGVISKGNFTYFYTLPFLHEALRLLNRQNPESKAFKVLDVGCGVGALSLYLASLGHRVTGIDISKRAIAIASKAQKHSGLPAVFKEMELSELREKDFDLVICSEVIEHIEDNEGFAKTLKEKLKPEGILYLSTPSSQNLLTKIGYYKTFDAEVGHLRRYTKASLKDDLQQSGFEVITQRSVEGPLRNVLFTSKLGFLIKFIRGPFISLFHFFDALSAKLFGASDIQVLATPAPRKLHIVQVTPRYAPHVGGVETHVKRVTEQLEKEGHHVTVITSNLKPSALYKLEIWKEMLTQKKVFEEADVVQIHDVAWWLFPLYWTVRKKLFITFHGWETKWPVSWKAKAHRWLWSHLAKGTVHVGDWIREFYWDDPNVVMYGGVDAPRHAAEAPKTLPKKGGVLKVLFLGRIAEDNQVKEYGKAVELLKKEYKVEMIWSGEGPLFDDTSWHKKDEQFLGAVSNPASLLQQAHIVFANSYLAVLEALAAGCIVGVLEHQSIPLKKRYFETFPLRDSLLFGSSAADLVSSITTAQPHDKNELLLKSLSWQSITNTYLQLWGLTTVESRKIPAITFLTHTQDIGGAETFNLDLLTELHKNAVAVTAYTNNDTYKKMLNQSGIVARAWFGLFDVIGDWKGLVKSLAWLPFLLLQTLSILYKQRRSELILMSGYGEKLFVTPLAAFFGKRVVWIEFSPLDAVWGKFFGLPKWLYFNALKSTELVITPTDYGKTGLVCSGLPAEKIKVIACGRSLNSLLQIASITEQLPNKKYVACVSRFESGKGQDTLLYAWAELLKKTKEFALVLVGSGSEKWLSHLEKIVEQLDLRDSVIFAGRVQSVQPWMQNAEVVVFPSRWVLEGFGLVMIEAMAMGKTVIAFNHGPVPEVIYDKKTGLLVDTTKQDPVVGLARALEEALSSPKLRTTIGEKAQKAFMQHFTIEDIAKKYQEVL